MECGIGMSGSEQGVALLTAVKRGDLRLAATLIDAGADVNFISPHDGWSPLRWACTQNDMSMVSLLLSGGAYKSVPSTLRQIAPDTTISSDIINILLHNTSPSTKATYVTLQDRNTNDFNGVQNKRDLISQDIILKIRIANSTDSDFIEVEVLSSAVTYQNLLSVCCKELEINPDQVNRIRKLPDTRVRCDADVRRLKNLQELEIVLKESNMPASLNIYPSISTNKNQTVLY